MLKFIFKHLLNLHQKLLISFAPFEVYWGCSGELRESMKNGKSRALLGHTCAILCIEQVKCGRSAKVVQICLVLAGRVAAVLMNMQQGKRQGECSIKCGARDCCIFATATHCRWMSGDCSLLLHVMAELVLRRGCLCRVCHVCAALQQVALGAEVAWVVSPESRTRGGRGRARSCGDRGRARSRDGRGCARSRDGRGPRGAAAIAIARGAARRSRPREEPRRSRSREDPR
eukprot:6213406-Pleurochrysis_carterae.AAC.3